MQRLTHIDGAQVANFRNQSAMSLTQYRSLAFPTFNRFMASVGSMPLHVCNEELLRGISITLGVRAKVSVQRKEQTVQMGRPPTHSHQKDKADKTTVV